MPRPRPYGDPTRPPTTVEGLRTLLEMKDPSEPRGRRLFRNARARFHTSPADSRAQDPPQRTAPTPFGDDHLFQIRSPCRPAMLARALVLSLSQAHAHAQCRPRGGLRRSATGAKRQPGGDPALGRRYRPVCAPPASSSCAAASTGATTATVTCTTTAVTSSTTSATPRRTPRRPPVGRRHGGCPPPRCNQQYTAAAGRR